MDFEQIELSKENVQPLAAGRNVKSLARALKAQEENSPEKTRSIFDDGCSEFEDRLADEGLEDPMAVWDEYIKWAQQNATSDTLQKRIVPLLQRCTRAFQKDDRYKNDPRYLRAWIKYIDTVHDPADIFAFLEANGIGQRLALFYSSWALVLELKRSQYAEAYAKIEEGINKQAEPVEQLQFALKQFQHRMNKRTMDAMMNGAVNKPEEKPNPNARDFGDQLTKSRKVVKAAAPGAAPAGGLAGATRKAPAKAPAVVKGAGNKAGFAIFCDDAENSAPTSSGGKWDTLPSEKERSKENARAASQWTKEEAGTIPQKRARTMQGAAGAPPAPKAGVDFEMFQDEGLADKADAQAERRPVRLQLDGGLGEQRDREASERQHRPLEFLQSNQEEEQDFVRPPSASEAQAEGGSPTPCAQPSAAARLSPLVPAGFQLPQHSKQRSEDGTGNAGYNRAMLVLPEGQVISIEEARAFNMYGIGALNGSLQFCPPKVEASACDGGDADDVDMEFSPVKPLGMMSVLEDAKIPDVTNASPTMSNFGPKSEKKAAPSADTTPSFRSFKQVDTKRTPFASQTPMSNNAADETGCAFQCNDISMISKAANSTFFANSSRHTLCPGDANFTLHEDGPILHDNENVAPAGHDENVAPSQLNFAASGASRGEDIDFFRAAEGGSSPTIMTKNAKEQVLDLLPSPTATLGLFKTSQAQASPTICTKNARGQAHDLMPSPTETLFHIQTESKQFVEAGAPSPTVNTKKAASQAMNLMPSPTETVAFFKGGMQAVASPTINTKMASDQAFDLMPSPTETVAFGKGGFVAGDGNRENLFGDENDAQVPAPMSSGGWEIREDTNLKGFKPPPSVGFEIREDTVNLKGAAAGGFEIREDTNLKGFDKPQASGGFEIREDTNLKGFKICPDAAASDENAPPVQARQGQPSDENAPPVQARQGQPSDENAPPAPPTQKRGLAVKQIADVCDENVLHAAQKRVDTGVASAVVEDVAQVSASGVAVFEDAIVEKVVEDYKENKVEEKEDIAFEVVVADPGCNEEGNLKGGEGEEEEEEEEVGYDADRRNSDISNGVPPLTEGLNTIAEMSHDTSTLSSFGDSNHNNSSVEAKNRRATGIMNKSLVNNVLAEEGDDVEGETERDGKEDPMIGATPVKNCTSDDRMSDTPAKNGTSDDRMSDTPAKNGTSDDRMSDTPAKSGAEHDCMSDTPAKAASILGDDGSPMKEDAGESSPPLLGWGRRLSDLEASVQKKKAAAQDMEVPIEAAPVLLLSTSKLDTDGNEEKAKNEEKEEQEEKDDDDDDDDDDDVEETPISKAMRDSLRRSLDASREAQNLSSLQEGPDGAENAGGSEHVEPLEFAAPAQEEPDKFVGPCSSPRPSSTGFEPLLSSDVANDAGGDGTTVAPDCNDLAVAPVSDETASLNASLDASADASVNESTESNTTRTSSRSRKAVNYKEKPLNVKCRQGANPWSSTSANNTSVDDVPAESEAGGTNVSVVSADTCLGGGEGECVDVYSKEELARQVKRANAVMRRDSSVVSLRSEAAPSVRVGSRLELSSRLMHVEAVSGKGAFATVYKAREMLLGKGLMEGLDCDDSLVALKFISAPSQWESYISRRLHSSLDEQARPSFIQVKSTVNFSDASVLATEHVELPSMQQLLNSYRKANKKMDEQLCMFYALELLRCVEACHKCGIIHGDIKPDNVMLRDDTAEDQEWEYSAETGFGSKGIKLIDFGCAIDTQMYGEGTVFRGKSGTEAFECVEMQEGRVWRKQLDLYAVAATVHCLLHSEYMEVEASGDAGSYRPRLPLKRYWQVEAWTKFFDACINSGSDALEDAKRPLQAYFAANPAKAAGLRMQLIKQDIMIDQYPA